MSVCSAASCTYSCNLIATSGRIAETRCQRDVLCRPLADIRCTAVCADKTKQDECNQRAVDKCLSNVQINFPGPCNSTSINTCPAATLMNGGCFGSGDQLPTNDVALNNFEGCGDGCTFSCSDPDPTGVWACEKPSAAACFGADDRSQAVSYQRTCTVSCDSYSSDCTKDATPQSCVPWAANVTCNGVEGGVLDDCDRPVTCLPIDWNSNSTFGMTVIPILVGTWLDVIFGCIVVATFCTYIWWCGKTQFYIDDLARESKDKDKTV